MGRNKYGKPRSISESRRQLVYKGHLGLKAGGMDLRAFKYLTYDTLSFLRHVSYVLYILL